MKRVVSSLILAGSLLSASASTEIMAVKYSGDLNKIDSNSKAWQSAKATQVEAYPQTTIKLNDKKANSANANNSAKKVNVYALYNDKNVAFKLEWADGTKNVYKANSTDAYADGFALQFPQDYSNAQNLPYIGMGSKDRAVVVNLQKAYEGVYEPNGNGDVAHQISRNNTNYFKKDLEKFDKKVASLATDYQKTFIAEGFRSMTEVRDEKFNSNMTFSDNKWSGIVSQKLKTDYLNLDSGAFPVALAIWDGEKLNRDGLKHLTGWLSVKLDGKSGGENLTTALNNTPVNGDLKNGKEQFDANCIACHNTNSKTDSAPASMAPNLANIGGYALASYIKESLLKPSAVVVPGYNRNAHKNFEWYTINEKGERVSTMPAYDWLDEKTLNDIVAYTQTLKAEVK